MKKNWAHLDFSGDILVWFYIYFVLFFEGGRRKLERKNNGDGTYGIKNIGASGSVGRSELSGLIGPLIRFSPIEGNRYPS